MKSKEDQTINEGINILHALMRPGERMSVRDIAASVGCSRGLVFHIEKTALKKVRDKLRKQKGLSYGEFSVLKSVDL